MGALEWMQEKLVRAGYVTVTVIYLAQSFLVSTVIEIKNLFPKTKQKRLDLLKLKRPNSKKKKT